jgi:hypothetical protein
LLLTDAISASATEHSPAAWCRFRSVWHLVPCFLR